MEARRRQMRAATRSRRARDGGTFNSADYTIIYDTGTLTVSAATLTVTPNAVSTPFSDVALNNTSYSDNTANYTISGFQNGQTLGTSGVTLSGLMAFNGSTGAIASENAYLHASELALLAVAGTTTT